MKDIAVAALAALLVTTPSVATEAAGPGASLEGTTGYCLGDVCLGMTWRDVDGLPGQARRRAAGCAGSDQVWRVDYTDREGGRVELAVVDPPGPAVVEDRARVRQIRLRTAHRLAARVLADGLAQQWSLDPIMDAAPAATRAWQSAVHPVSLVLREDEGSPVQQSVLIAALGLPDTPPSAACDDAPAT